MIIDIPEAWVLVIGFSGLACSMLYRIPQIYRIWKTKRADDISVWTIHIQNTSYIIYVIYGLLIYDMVYIISSIVSIIQNVIILGLRWYFFLQDSHQSVHIPHVNNIDNV